MGRTSTFQTGLVLIAMLVVAIAIGWLFLAPALETISISIPAAEVRATEQEMEEAWQNLVDAIQREDQQEALRLAEWLDEQQSSESSTAPTANLEIVKTWCALRGEVEGICKE